MAPSYRFWPKCRLQSENLEKLIFVTKIGPMIVELGCKSSSNLWKFIGINVDLEKELEQFEGAF